MIFRQTCSVQTAGQSGDCGVVMVVMPEGLMALARSKDREASNLAHVDAVMLHLQLVGCSPCYNGGRCDGMSKRSCLVEVMKAVAARWGFRGGGNYRRW